MVVMDDLSDGTVRQLVAHALWLGLRRCESDLEARWETEEETLYFGRFFIVTVRPGPPPAVPTYDAFVTVVSGGLQSPLESDDVALREHASLPAAVRAILDAAWREYADGMADQAAAWLEWAGEDASAALAQIEHDHAADVVEKSRRGRSS